MGLTWDLQGNYLGFAAKLKLTSKNRIFYITLQLVTHSVVRFYMPMSCSGDSFCFTRHPLVTFLGVTSELAMQLILYQYDISLNGDEWVTSVLK